MHSLPMVSVVIREPAIETITRHNLYINLYQHLSTVCDSVWTCACVCVCVFRLTFNYLHSVRTITYGRARACACDLILRTQHSAKPTSTMPTSASSRTTVMSYNHDLKMEADAVTLLSGPSSRQSADRRELTAVRWHQWYTTAVLDDCREYVAAKQQVIDALEEDERQAARRRSGATNGDADRSTFCTDFWQLEADIETADDILAKIADLGGDTTNVLSDADADELLESVLDSTKDIFAEEKAQPCALFHADDYDADDEADKLIAEDAGDDGDSNAVSEIVVMCDDVEHTVEADESDTCGSGQDSESSITRNDILCVMMTAVSTLIWFCM